MKTRILFLLATLIGLSVNAQTTLEEYNYLTKGYKIQQESGLDMKKGYRIEYYHTNHSILGKTKRIVEFKGLFRDGESHPCAILMIYKKDRNSDYFCIPHYDSSEEIWRKYFDKVSGYSDSEYAARTMLWSLAKSAAFFARENSSTEFAEESTSNGNIEGIKLGSGTIGGGLGSRGVSHSPRVSCDSKNTGKVVLKVCVDRSGKVTSTEYTQRGSTTNASDLVDAAIENAKQWRFNGGRVYKQCGTITYNFRAR